MNLILGIETATGTCSVAVHREGILLAEHSYYLDRSHSNLLAPCIEHIMHDCGFELSALQRSRVLHRAEDRNIYGQRSLLCIGYPFDSHQHTGSDGTWCA